MASLFGISSGAALALEAAKRHRSRAMLMVTRKRGFLVMGRRELPDFKTTP
jgi:surfactin synthase thioesterase subunit